MTVGSVALICAIVAIIVLLGVFRAEEKWCLVAQGKLNKIIYREETYSKRSGAMVHTTKYYTVRYNDIYFFGGTVLYDVEGKLDDFEPGTQVHLMKSNYDDWRLERAT